MEFDFAITGLQVSAVAPIVQDVNHAYADMVGHFQGGDITIWDADSIGKRFSSS